MSEPAGNPPSNAPVSEYYYFLDGLRGISAILVAIYHVSNAVGKPLVPAGYLAVDFFFVLSGFVVAHAYQKRLEQKSNHPA